MLRHKLSPRYFSNYNDKYYIYFSIAVSFMWAQISLNSSHRKNLRTIWVTLSESTYYAGFHKGNEENCPTLGL